MRPAKPLVRHLSLFAGSICGAPYPQKSKSFYRRIRHAVMKDLFSVYCVFSCIVNCSFGYRCYGMCQLCVLHACPTSNK